MDYIINPWWFYFIQVCGTLKSMFYIIGATAIFIGAVACVIKYGEACIEEEICDFDKAALTVFKRVFVIGVVVFILSALIPTKDTFIKMQIAKFGTYSNAEKVLKVIDEKTDALIDAIGNGKDNN